ncbi:MAG: ATP-binding cassette domain-containing protein [bacterium]|nr:ATP-binding cassette domain-containing protein [bacterium]
MLYIKNLHVEISGKEILKGINLEIKERETCILFGINGGGKTSLLLTIMGFSGYNITKGEIIFKEKVINDLPINERVGMGIGISLQRPPVVRGVKTRQMIEIASKGLASCEELAGQLNLLDFLDRDINLNFSGGEMKRSELLQLIAQSPDLVLLDEPESGVDLENMALVGKICNNLLEKHLHRKRKKSGLIITHTGYILDYLEADKGYVLANGRISCMGNPREILEDIRKRGYEECMVCKR